MLTFRYMSPLGPMLLASENGLLVGAWFEGQKYFGQGVCADAEDGEDAVLSPISISDEEVLGHQHISDEEVLRQAKEWLDRYFRGEETGALPPLRVDGSPLRKAVKRIMLQIPYGQTTTYGQIAAEAARMLGLQRMSAQAVGGAVGHNPIAIFIPCHRVVAADGGLTGYAGGIDKKKALLEIENPNMGKGHNHEA